MARKIKRTRGKTAKVATQMAHIKAQRGLDREAHFAEGKDLASWRGCHTVTKDRKREASRRACRTKVQF